MAVRAVIVDDEPLARRGIRQLLGAHPDVDVVAECTNGAEALGAIATGAPDLVFLDVQMPEIDGFEVVRRLGAGRMPAVVFVTAHDEFAVQAFEACAVDYLMKPVGAARFAAAMRRVGEQRDAVSAVRRMRELQALLDRVAAGNRAAAEAAAASGAGSLPVRLVVTTAHGSVLVDPAEIDWIGADDYYAVLHVAGKRYLLRESLASLEARLPAELFIRVHRSAIVNRTRVRELRRGVVILHDGTRASVSRRRRAAVVAALRRGVARRTAP